MQDEWEEEEQLVVVELSGIINNEFLTRSWETCKILDIDSEKPMMQIGQYVFAGEYEDSLGACVLFEEGPQKEKAASDPELKYMCHTVKKLMMQRIFLTEKKEGSGDDDEQDNTCQSNQEDEADLQGEVDEEISNTDLEDLAAS
ncbi:general transcription factor 3C polypeptide 6 [Anabas testudineus]|uniref:Transcription factor TFIIIC triple barrel domain-containing protein n=1 Tax=Anabas testudineus TaxID=64144 RepID=A0A3Q1H6P4_ANATE|nr:general transcription factor 3C polypeptide 6 [Anabas testudineus]